MTKSLPLESADHNVNSSDIPPGSRSEKPTITIGSETLDLIKGYGKKIRQKSKILQILYNL